MMISFAEQSYIKGSNYILWGLFFDVSPTSECQVYPIS